MHRDDLWWFFNDSASELGEKSNFGALVALIEGGGGGSAGGLDGVAMLPVESDHAMRASKRWRRIRHTLGLCDDAAATILQAFHTQKNRGQLDVDYPDGFSGVVLLLLGGKTARKSDRDELRERAREAVAAALGAYRDACAAVMA